MSARRTGAGAEPVTPAEYRALASFRRALRGFLRFSEDAARAVGVTPAQHQLLLAIKGFPGDGSPSVGELAEALQLRHHSAVELVDRAASAGLVRRIEDRDDARRFIRCIRGGDIGKASDWASTVQCLSRLRCAEQGCNKFDDGLMVE